MKKKDIITIFIVILIIIIDQISKICIMNFQGDSIIIIEGILQLNIIKNKGIAFSFADKNLIGIIFTDILVLFILVKFLIRQKQNIDIPTQISLMFIISGGISNLIDRIFKGGVIDFIDISKCIKSFPIFNIADIFIIIGFIMFVILTWINLNNLRKEKLGGKQNW